MAADTGRKDSPVSQPLPADPEDRPGDPACLLRRVCPACGAVAPTDPPTTCPDCGTDMPGT